MLKAKIPSITIRNRILLFGAINCLIYISVLMFFRFMGLLNLPGLRMLNYFLLSITSILEIHRWTKHLGRYIPSLQSFALIFFTGAVSFALFAVFMFIYSFYDPYLMQSYFDLSENLNPMYSMIIFLEGLAGSILVSLISMMYSDRYRNGEAHLD
jgi:hypothetical protein